MIVFGKERDYIMHDKNNVKGFFGEYRFLSNFEVSDVFLDGLLYTSTEAAYQSAKTLSMQEREKFTKLAPKDAMRAGRELQKTELFRTDWEEVKFDIMSVVVFDKFYRNLSLREKLISTERKHLEETNHWKDIYWGVCDGVGQNNLGLVLMNVRNFWSHRKDNKYTRFQLERAFNAGWNHIDFEDWFTEMGGYKR